MKCGHSKFCVELRNHFTIKTTFKPIYSFYYSGNFLERGIKTPNKSFLEMVTTRLSNIMISSCSRRLNINLIIAETEKVEEKNLEVLVDDAGNYGMSTSDAITYIGIFIFCCFIFACCAIVICKK